MVNALENAPIRSSFCDDEDFLELIEMFVDGIEEKKMILREASADQVEELKVLAHQMKGASAGYGFEELSQLAADLETACKAEDRAEIEREKEIVLNHMNRIVL
ncbi:Hpt domain-containing protein [uncultured Gimesia sp.]|uniref:Hpt domain-containing protein n=1 Tax=uncultured Gimesia sp. TaxID=1678688 RepID=UPI0030DAD1AF|tara:strand:+ start:21708 stop:22019 length:312 start_codon:yes stop_codon:yes gene_type:complete